MKHWRLLKLRTADAFTNMAIDEAIMKARIEKRVPNTLRFYQWNPSAVTIGRFQTLKHEVNIRNCKKHGIDIVRRISGGGTVYHDGYGEITYSIVTKINDLGCKKLDMLCAYQKICGGLNEAVKILGIKAEYRPPEQKTCPNLTIKGKKISGNAQISKKGILLQHGTFMMDIDYKKMFTFLKVSWTNNLDDILQVSKRKLTSARQELGFNFSTQDAYRSLIFGFQKSLNIALVETGLTKYEQNLAERLKKEKYGSEEWNLFGKISV
jgi:lipoate-protein ligase A